jgi:hypothetical protein
LWTPIPPLKIAPAACLADGDQHAGIGSGQHAFVLLPVIGAGHDGDRPADHDNRAGGQKS